PEKFALCPPKQEAIPAGLKPEYPLLDPNPTFLAWHPGGKLLWGSPDGTVTAWPGVGPKPETVTKEHKGAVRGWTVTGAACATGVEVWWTRELARGTPAPTPPKPKIPPDG